MQNDTKKDAHQFLGGLHQRLMNELPPPSVMRARIEEMVQNAKKDGSKILHEPEYAFLNGFVVPAIFAHMQTVANMSAEIARQALLSEWYRGMPQFHQTSPRRQFSHPFGKSQRDAAKILQRWRGEELDSSGRPRKPLHQACPDLAFGEPFPHRVVFEVKYFAKGDAGANLVNGIYETFYYLAMPRIPASKTHPAWHYDFGCFVAFDASMTGALHDAWSQLNAQTQNGFWDGGNLFVMVLRPKENAM
jgi:hypothetical protein